MKRIELAEEEVKYLKEFTKKGQKSARALTRAHVLLLVHKGKKETAIAEILSISRATVSNIKKRYREEGLQIARWQKEMVAYIAHRRDAEEGRV
jgi:DNA invertase Pin-like site-specific DNA recombinase